MFIVKTFNHSLALLIGNSDVCERVFAFLCTLNLVNRRNPIKDIAIPIRAKVVIGTEKSIDVTTIANNRLRQLSAACLITEILESI